MGKAASEYTLAERNYGGYGSQTAYDNAQAEAVASIQASVNRGTTLSSGAASDIQSMGIELPSSTKIFVTDPNSPDYKKDVTIQDYVDRVQPEIVANKTFTNSQGQTYSPFQSQDRVQLNFPKQFGGGRFGSEQQLSTATSNAMLAEAIRRQAEATGDYRSNVATTMTSQDRARSQRVQDTLNPIWQATGGIVSRTIKSVAKNDVALPYIPTIKRTIINALTPSPKEYMYEPGASTQTIIATPETIKQAKLFGESGTTWIKDSSYPRQVLSGLVEMFPGTVQETAKAGATLYALGLASKYAPLLTKIGFTGYGGKSTIDYFGSASGTQEKRIAAAGTLGLLSGPRALSGTKNVIGDILASTQKIKPIVENTLFIEPKRGNVQGQIVRNIITPEGMSKIDMLKLKDTPSQFIGPEILDIQGKKLVVAHVTSGDLFKPLSGRSTITNIPGSIVRRPFESGLYTSIPEKITGKPQAFTYYAKGSEGTSGDLFSGKAKPTLGGRPKIYIGEVNVQNYPKELLTGKITPEQLSSTEVILGQIRSGKAPSLSLDVTPEQGSKFALEIIKRAGGTTEGVAREQILGSYASKTPGFRPGTGAILGFKPESELVGGAGTIIGRNSATFRGKVGKILGFGDFPVKVDGQTFEVNYIKEIPNKKVGITTIEPLTTEEKASFFKSKIQDISSGKSSSDRQLYYDVSKPLSKFGSISSLSLVSSTSSKDNSRSSTNIVGLTSYSPIVSNVSYDKVSSVNNSSQISRPNQVSSLFTPNSTPNPVSYNKVSSVSDISRVSGLSKVSNISRVSPVGYKQSSYLMPPYSNDRIDLSNMKSKKRTLRTKGFDILIKRKGKWNPLGVSLSERQAGLLAQKKLKQSLAASARLVPTARAMQKANVNFIPRSGEFRQYNINKGQKIFNPRLFIQNVGGRGKSFSRLGTRAERTEINVARQTIIQTRKKRKGGIFI